MKIYTLSAPPSSEDPYLNARRHGRILRKFAQGCNACHTLNSSGEVDFYLLLTPEEQYEDLPDQAEEFALNLSKDQKLRIEVFYDEELFGSFPFDLDNQLDSYCLHLIATQKSVNIYFIFPLEEYYVCYGFKTIQLPSLFCYDLSRQLTGLKPLILPTFSEDSYSDEFFSREILLSKAWGFYMDYTTLVERLGSSEDAEEIISLHILHGMARLQKSRRKAIRDDRLILWVGRRVRMDDANKPKEYYGVYLSGAGLVGLKSKDAAVKIIEDSLKELPEYWGYELISPLAEEAIPLVVFTDNNLYRLNLAERFYTVSQQFYTEHCNPGKDYQSYYDKLHILQSETMDSKIYNLWLKRWEQGYDEAGQLPVGDIEELIEKGQEEDLTRIFMLLTKVADREIDNLMVKICESYQGLAEPYLLAGLEASTPHLKAAALLGLGILESTQAIPSLVRLIRQDSESQILWDNFLMIGDPAVPALANLLHEPNSLIRKKALETLTLLGSPAAREIMDDFTKPHRP